MKELNISGSPGFMIRPVKKILPRGRPMLNLYEITTSESFYQAHYKVITADVDVMEIVVLTFFWTDFPGNDDGPDDGGRLRDEDATDFPCSSEVRILKSIKMYSSFFSVSGASFSSNPRTGKAGKAISSSYPSWKSANRGVCPISRPLNSSSCSASFDPKVKTCVLTTSGEFSSTTASATHGAA